MSFAKLKKSSKSSFGDLKDKMQKENQKGYNDPRFWEPTVDKAGNGYAVIRFLPECEGSSLQFAKVFTHGFKMNNKWFIDDCLTTINQECPICESNTLAWNSGTEEGKLLARKRKRTTRYIANILVIEDSKNPEAVGNVYLYKVNQQIFKKIANCIEPMFEDEEPYNPFCFWEGANFKVKIFNNEGGFRDYERSEFAAREPLFDGDDKLLEALWKKQYPLEEFLEPGKFKSYEDIKRRFQQVSGQSVDQVPSNQGGPQPDENQEERPRRESQSSRPNFKSNPAPVRRNDSPIKDDDDDDVPWAGGADDDESLAEYASLLNG